MRVLIAAAHADDEVLGAGGVIAKHVAAGGEVRILITADCRTARHGEQPELLPAALQAATVLGAEVRFLGKFGMSLDRLPELELNQLFEAEVADFKPEVVYTHYGHDLNSDHRAVSRAIAVATRPFGACSPMGVMQFEVPSSTGWETPAQFSPNMFVDISDVLDKKLEALRCYEEELRPAPHPRSIEGIRVRAAYWGQQCGVHFAEPFIITRAVMRTP